MYAAHRDLDTHALYKKARQQLKKIKQVAKNQWILHQVREANRSLLPGGKDRKSGAGIWKMAKKLKRGLSKWRAWGQSNVKNTAGIMATTPDENADNFTTFYNNLYNNEVNEDSEAWGVYRSMLQTPTDREWRPPTTGELKRAAKELKDTSPGISGVGSRVWKALARDAESSILLLQIMQECWQKKTVPAEWLKLHTITLPKKGDLSQPDNWRGISMAESLSKLYTTILKHRLGNLYETIVPEYCNGFRRGRGRTDCIFTVKDTLRKRKAKGLCSYIVYWDIKKML
jgi:hypothetical protein